MGKGWLGVPLIKKRLRKVKKIEARNMREPFGMGSRGLVKGLDGAQGQKTLVGVRGRSPRKLLCFSMQKQHFQHKLYIH